MNSWPTDENVEIEHVGCLACVPPSIGHVKKTSQWRNAVGTDHQVFEGTCESGHNLRVERDVYVTQPTPSPTTEAEGA